MKDQVQEQEKYLTYQLLTKRVCGLNKDNTPKIETILVKLGGSVLLKKYCKFLPTRGYIKSDPPKIIKVLDKSGKECDEKEIVEAQKVVDKLLNVSKVETPVDYKLELEKEKKRTDDLERRLNELESKSKPGRKKVSSTPKKKVESKNDGLEQVLDVLENRNKEKREPTSSGRLELETIAKEIGVQFRSNIGDAELLEKIREIEPNYKPLSNE